MIADVLLMGRPREGFSHDIHIEQALLIGLLGVVGWLGWQQY